MIPRWRPGSFENGGQNTLAGSDMHKEPPRPCEFVPCFGMRKTKQKSLNTVRLQRVHIRSFGYNPSQFVSTVCFPTQGNSSRTDSRAGRYSLGLTLFAWDELRVSRRPGASRMGSGGIQDSARPLSWWDLQETGYRQHTPCDVT